MPILPVVQVIISLSVNSLAFSDFHAMEEVVGSIPTRSTKSIQRQLSGTPSQRLVANFNFLRRQTMSIVSSSPF